MKKLSLKAKLILSCLGLGLLPQATSNLISFNQTKDQIHEEAAEKGRVLLEAKEEVITSYFESELIALVDLASQPSVATALREFSKPFTATGADSQFQEADMNSAAYQEVMDYYKSAFGTAYKEKNGGKVAPTSEIVAKLDKAAIAAQFDFIVKNPNPLGQKQKLDRPWQPGLYGDMHAKMHPKFRAYLERHGLYDVFLINNEGRVVYSVFKETDFATSLTQGPWAESGLSRIFHSAKGLADGQTHLEDFAPYQPSYEAPASFAGSPIYEDGRRIGVLVVQLPLDKISTVLSSRDGLGEKGETLLFGSDGKLRADTFRNKNTHSVLASFSPDSKVVFTSEAIKKAMAGETGYIEAPSYDGVAVLSAYKPIKIKNLNWFMLVEFADAEVYAGLKSLEMGFYIVLAVAMLLASIYSFTFSSSVAKILTRISDQLETSNQELTLASSQSASSSTELSEAATEQAASLQETMASVEEISAMVTQNAESASRVNEAVDQNQVATQDGSQSVNEMLQSIQEIKMTTDEILGQMESSNKEFGEIVKIIKTIDDKTKVINDIVFQTKLLSFNASVEAARAGEHGKGFAVVAEEVGNLAQMSGNAAKEITTMLSSSIQKVNEIVEKTSGKIDQLVEVGKDKIASGQSKALACRAALEKISQNATSVKTMVTEITHASKEQSQGIQEISKAVAQLDQVTQQNSAVAQQSSSQAEQLHSQAQVLSATVSDLVMFVAGKDVLERASSEHRPSSSSFGSKISVLKPLRLAKKSPEVVKESVPLKKAAGENGHGTTPKYEDF